MTTAAASRWAGTWGRLRRPCSILALAALGLGGHLPCFAQNDNRDGGQMWSDQPPPDFDRLGKGEASATIKSDVHVLAAMIPPYDKVEFTVFKLDKADTGDAYARRTRRGGRDTLEVYYAAGFDNRQMPSGERLGKYIVLAHELAHHLLNHTRIGAAPITMRQELEADRLAGCLVARLVFNEKTPVGEDSKRLKGSTDDIESYFRKHNSDPADGVHPPIETRLKRVLEGWFRPVTGTGVTNRNSPCLGMAPIPE